MHLARRIRPVLVAVVVLAWAVVGCSDDDGPVKPPLPGPTIVTIVRSTPQNVLELLQAAYRNRDSLAMGELHDTSYVGSSTDLSDQNPQTLTFTRADEIRVVGALRRSPTVSSVFLDFGLPSSWNQLPSDEPAHPDWTVIQMSNVRLQITDGVNSYDASSGTDVITFKFAPTPDASSPTDTLWKIVRWEEIRSSGGP